MDAASENSTELSLTESTLGAIPEPQDGKFKEETNEFTSIADVKIEFDPAAIPEDIWSLILGPSDFTVAVFRLMSLTSKAWRDRPWRHLRQLLVESHFHEEARMATGERMRSQPLRLRHNYLFEPALSNLTKMLINGDVCDTFDWTKDITNPCPGLLEGISRQKCVGQRLIGVNNVQNSSQMFRFLKDVHFINLRLDGNALTVMLSPSGQSLRKLRFEHCSLQKSSFTMICKLCPNLRWLDLGSDMNGSVDADLVLKRFPMKHLQVLMFPLPNFPPTSKEYLPSLSVLILTGAGPGTLPLPRTTGASLPSVKRIIRGDFPQLISPVGNGDIFVRRESHLMSLLSEIIWSEAFFTDALETVQYLLSSGSDPNLHLTLSRVAGCPQTNEDEASMFSVDPLLVSIIVNRVDIANALLQAKVEVTPFVFVRAAQNLEVQESTLEFVFGPLLEAGIGQILSNPQRVESLFPGVSGSELKEAAKFYLLHDAIGKNPLFYASSASSVQFLVKSAPQLGIGINDVDHLGSNALHHCCTPGAATELIKAGININTKDFSDNTPIMAVFQRALGADHHHLGVIEVLLSTPGLIPPSPDWRDYRIGLLELLDSDRAPDALRIVHKLKNTFNADLFNVAEPYLGDYHDAEVRKLVFILEVVVIHRAYRGEYLPEYREMAEIFLSAGADPNIVMMDPPTQGLTLLDAVVYWIITLFSRQRHISPRDRIRYLVTMASLLLHHRADPRKCQHLIPCVKYLLSLRKWTNLEECIPDFVVEAAAAFCKVGLFEEVQQIVDIVAAGMNKSRCKALSKRIQNEISPFVSDFILKDSKNAAQLTFVAEALHLYFREQIEAKKAGTQKKMNKEKEKPQEEDEEDDQETNGDT